MFFLFLWGGGLNKVCCWSYVVSGLLCVACVLLVGVVCCCPLFVICCSLFGICRWLMFDVCCFGACCLSFVVRCWLFVDCCCILCVVRLRVVCMFLLFVVCCLLLCVMCCLLLGDVVCCLLFVVRFSLVSGSLFVVR